MICPQCGNENQAQARFCFVCGFILNPDRLPDESDPALTLPGKSPQADNISSVRPADPTLMPSSAQATLPGITPPLPQLPSPERQEDGSLAPGVVLAERYRILGMSVKENDSVLYQAEDIRQCWSCGTVQADSSSRFCDMCGAELTLKNTLKIREVRHQDISGEGIFHLGEFTYQLEPSTPAVTENEKVGNFGLFAGYASDTGRRRDINEDSLIVMQLSGLCNLCTGPNIGLYAIADGIGGQEAGEVASQTALQTLASSVIKNIFIHELARTPHPASFSTDKDTTDPVNPLTIDQIERRLKKAILAANQAILTLTEQRQDKDSMGCTLTTALVRDKTAIIANVGDSRTYRMHAGKLEQITRDHSLVARLVESGAIAPEQASTHEKKSVIYRSLGDTPEIEIDTFQIELEVGDRLLLCCDGLWEMLQHTLIEDILLEYFDPQSACKRLVALANDAGGEDNISVIVVNVQAV
jgi:protein phosphatase